MTQILESSGKVYTVSEFLDLDLLDDEQDYELIGGKIVAGQGHTSGKHGDVVTRLATYLNVYAGVYAKEKMTGKVYTETSCTLGQPDGLNFPKPDVCFVLNGRTPVDFTGPIPVAPDLVVKVWSPTDTDERRLDKIKAYLTAEIPLIWSIHMLDKYIMVYRHGQPRSFLDLDDELSGEGVIPGFSLSVRALFD